jgi:multiple sugar transport system ATP-binding protein
MAVVETKDLKTYFGNVKAVDGIDLSIQEGELLVILGPSGCGKTTLMRTIAGLEQPVEGEVIIAGQVVNGLPPRDRHIAMVFQSYALYPHMTVFNNIAFPLRAQGGITKDDLNDKVDWAASILGVSELLHRKPRQLSGGERQRVALCRALVREPTVLLLDEPLSNLDAKLRASARHELQRFQQRMGITTIFVTHDQVEAMGLGDRIAVMNKGKVRQIGTPQEIYHDSADTFVAAFLGSPGMNLLDRGDFLLGFRPEHFLPKTEVGASSDVTGFNFTVGRVEHLGSDRLLYGVVDSSSADVATVAKLPSTVTIEIQSDQTYDFVVQSHHLRFFDKQTGVRIDPRPL